MSAGTDRREALLSGGNSFRFEELTAMAEDFERAGVWEFAASAWDRAYGLRPEDGEVSARRRSVLDRLAVEEAGLLFRYIPAGPFSMGSFRGEVDEDPVHSVELDAFWMAEIPLRWSDGKRLMAGIANGPLQVQLLSEGERQRRLFCLPNSTLVPTDGAAWEEGPMVAVSWAATQQLLYACNSAGFSFHLPTEAQWEKAARGGLVGAAYSWGEEPPTALRCDFDRLEECSVHSPYKYAANGYGLYGMCGGVWEWCADFYDALYYAQAPVRNPTGPTKGEERVLRGGSWCDCAEAVTVSFRNSKLSNDTRRGGAQEPNVGVRFVRTRRG